MAYVKSLKDFGGNKYDIKDAAAMKDVDLVGSNLSFYDGDQNLIKTVTLSGGAQKWTAGFTQQYVDTIKRSMALTPTDFTISDVKVGDIIVASDTNQYADLPTGWLVNWNAGDSSQVGILVLDNADAQRNLYYPLGSNYEYMFIVNYVDTVNNKVYVHMIPCAHTNILEDCMPTTLAMFANPALALAPLAKYAPYYLIESGKDVLGICVEDTGTSFSDFGYPTTAVTMCFTDGKYIQHLDFGEYGYYALMKRKVYRPSDDNAANDEMFLGMPEYIATCNSPQGRKICSIYPSGSIIDGPQIDSKATKYAVFETLVPGNLTTARAAIAIGQWY